MKGVNIFLADGFEEVEALGTADVLRRGGIDVRLISITDEPFVISSHNMTVGIDECFCDMDLSVGSVSEKDVMIFPGGMPGTKNLAACKPLIDEMNRHYAEGGTVAAICAAPGFVLGQLEGISGVPFTGFDGCETRAVEAGGVFIPKPAITSGRIITGRSSGHSLAFGLEILKKLAGEEKAAEVAYGMFLTCE